MAYSYEDFENAANQAGLLGQFSQYDLDLARAHPEAGLSILSLKKDYANATTPEQKALINEAVNQVRSSYGSYTGGTDGSQYYAVTPHTQTSDIDQQINGVLGQIGSYGSFAYENDDAYKAALAAVVNADPFSFDYGNADMYQRALEALANAPSFNFDYANQDAYQKAMDAVANAPSFEYGKEAPTYVNAYEQQQKDLLDKVVNREQFSYDKDTDPVYGSYKKSYLREGDRATANALAQASAASGGRASSYAVNAATQAGDYYATKLNDIIPTLYQQAFDRYLQEYQMKLSDLNAVNGQEQLDYQRYLNELGQFNTDRGFALDAYNTNAAQRLNALNALLSDRGQQFNEQMGAYDADRQARMDAMNALMSDRGQQYNEQMGAYDANAQARLNALNALTGDRQLAYGEWADQYEMLQNYLKNLQGQSDTIYARALDDENRRLAERQYADKLTQQDFENQLALATYAAELGDYSLLEALGINPNTENVYQLALAAAGKLAGGVAGGTAGGTGGTGGGYTGGGTGGSGGSGNGGKTEVDAAFKQTVLATYPDGVVTNPDDWQTLLAYYDEETLKAAGITYKGADQQGAGAAGDGLTTSAYNTAARGILENWQSGKADAARQGIADIWNSLSAQQQENLRTTLINAGAGALFNSGTGSAGNGYVPMGDLNRESNHSGTGGLEINLGSVEALGYGPISAERLAELVQQGLVEEYVKDGQRYFRRVQQPLTGANNLFSISGRFG